MWSFGGAWSQGRHQRPKTAAAFSERAAMLLGERCVGCVQRYPRRLASEKSSLCLSIAVPSLACVRLQQRSSDSKRAMNLHSHVRNRWVGWICRPRYPKACARRSPRSISYLAAGTRPSARKAPLTSVTTSADLRASGVRTLAARRRPKALVLQPQYCLWSIGSSLSESPASPRKP